MIKGDVNLDGVVNEVDEWLIQQAVVEKFFPNSEERRAGDMDNSGGRLMMKDFLDLHDYIDKLLPGDVNGDGVVDAKDAEMLKKQLLKLLRLDKYVESGSQEVCVKDVALLQKLIDGIIASYIAQQPKRNKVTIQLGEFEKGEYLCWFVTTQAAYKVTVTLRDDKKIYFSADKESVAIMPPLNFGKDEYIGKNLVLEISIPQSDEIRPLPSMNTIISDTGKVLGHSFTCCGEDWTDNDYNDFYINIVGWKSKK